MNEARSAEGFHLLDVASLVVGYGLASLLIRAYPLERGTNDVWVLGVLGLAFVWLGLAMSGPIVLLVRRPAPSSAGLVVDPDIDERSAPRTWAEMAWLIIGFYWIGLTILVVPARLRGARFLDTAFLGFFPVLAALGLRMFGQRLTRPASGTDSWTHRVGVVLLVTWPFAWVALILLGKSVP
ncbi:MAG: hypothetical protein NVSMB9_26590 [Isosphaeraceae bacterium]